MRRVLSFEAVVIMASFKVGIFGSDGSSFIIGCNLACYPMLELHCLS